MKEFLTTSTYFGVFFCLGAYVLGIAIQKKVRHPLVNGMLIADILVIGVLLLLDIDYEKFQESAQPLSYLLTPATVCLAIPLYQQLEQLKKHWKAIAAGILSGTAGAMVSIWLLSLLLGLNHAEYVSLLPKSVTTAIGMGISEELNGYVAITISAIILTGLLGNIAGAGILKLLRVHEPVARGVAMGTASHAFGTARALELGPVEGAMSSLSIVTTGLITLVAAQIMAPLI